jgi:hypothetical protein
VRTIPGKRTVFAALGGLVAGLTWYRRSRISSVAVRALSGRRPNAATRKRIRVDLGAPTGDWSRTALAASLDHTLSEVVGRPVEGAAYSRFGDFEGQRRYSRFLDPTSLYYQAWLGAYVVLDSPDGRFGFSAAGDLRVEDALAVLEADQRLVYRSTGCPNRFSDGRATRALGELAVTPPTNLQPFWRLRGEAESWSNYCRGGKQSNGWGRALYGVVPADARHDVEDFHPLRYVGEFRVFHDEALGATCCSFLIAPRFVDRSGRELFPGQDLLRYGDALAGIRFGPR